MADIHFTPTVALKVVEYVEKVRKATLCYICSSANPSYFQNKRAMITQKDCNNFIEACLEFFKIATDKIQGFNTTPLNGQAKFTEKPNAPEQSLGACSATLAPRVSTNADPLNIVNPFKLESQQDLMLKPYSSLQ